MTTNFLGISIHTIVFIRLPTDSPVESSILWVNANQNGQLLPAVLDFFPSDLFHADYCSHPKD